MLLLAQLAGDRAGALANPAQRGLRIAAGVPLDHLIQCRKELWIADRERLAACSGAANPTLQRLTAPADLAHPLGDRLARQATGAMHQRHATVAQTDRLIGRSQPPRAFIQMGPDRTQLPFQLGQRIHASET